MKLNHMLLSLALVTTAVGTAQADSAPRTRDGFHLQVTGGFGYYSSSAEQGGSEMTMSGMSMPASLLMGGSIMPNLVLGGGLVLDYVPSPSFEQGGSDPTGLVSHLGVGYDWWISDQWSGGVMGRLVYAPLDFNGVSFTTFEPVLVGTLTWH
jgi:hypothetical protein